MGLVLSLVAGCGGSDSTAPSTGNSQPSVPATETFASSLGVNIASMTKLSDNLYYQDLVVGTGAVVQAGHSISATYAGFLKDGTSFGSGPTGLTPLSNFIAGWQQGIPGMQVGGKRLLVIGSQLGYGANANGPIPANSTLVFTVQMTGTQ